MGQQKFKQWLSDRLLIILLISLFLLIVFISAWLADDAYITFRTVDNFINGYGLTWNISERVQTYTHPLWMFVLSGFYFFTKEIYYTSLAVSIIISLTTVLLLLKLSDSGYNSVLVVLILIFSKAFIDFSTSGLENPLTHLLLILFFIIYYKIEDNRRKLFLLSITASLAALNRIDIILICLPILFISYFGVNKLKGIFIILIGLSPFIVWELFSLFYYGFFFPNTAYAKLNTGIEHFQLVEQGLHYILFSVYIDPLTPLVLLIGLIIPLLIKDKKLLPISIGIFLYLIYLINIGGDFMGGRFLSAPILCSVVIISKVKLNSEKSLIPLIATVVIIGLLSPKPTVLSTPDYGAGPKIYKAFRFGPYVVRSYHGIVDEKIWYYGNTGLINNIFEKKIYKFPWVKDALTTKSSNQNVIVKGVIGFWGYFIGRGVHIIDPLALSDPLLSKLHCVGKYPFDEFKPMVKDTWRIGHFTREIPSGYVETIRTGINQIEDPSLHKYYDKLTILIKGSLWDFNRLKEIWNFNLGKYNYLLVNFERNKNRLQDSLSTN